MTRKPFQSQLYSRRDVLGVGGRALLAGFLAQHAFRTGYASEVGASQIDDWVRRLDDVSRRLARGEISGLQWQEAMDGLYGAVPMRSLLRLIDFDRLGEKLSQMDIGSRGEIFCDIAIGPIPEESAQFRVEAPAAHTAIVKMAHVKKGRSIPPHGHSNMTSAFLCISGEFDVQLFDRLDNFEDSLVVRQTVDQKGVKPGSWSSISDYRNNVHWLTARSDDCFLFTCKLIKLEPDREFHGRININMHEAEPLGTNTWRAPKITGSRASELY
jgi:hypothetical protein